MTPRFPENISTWWSLVGHAAPPRDPNDEEADNEDEEDDVGDEDEDREPTIIREPD